MFILIAVMLAALVGVWLVYPLFIGKTVASERTLTLVGEEIEKEIDELRKQSGQTAEKSSGA